MADGILMWLHVSYMYLHSQDVRKEITVQSFRHHITVDQPRPMIVRSFQTVTAVDTNGV